MTRCQVIAGSALTLLHLGISIVLFVIVFGRSMDHFDAGTSPALWEDVLGWVLKGLSMPVLWLIPTGMPPVVQNSSFLLNSTLWGFVGGWCFCRLQSRKQTTADDLSNDFES